MVFCLKLHCHLIETRDLRNAWLFAVLRKGTYLCQQCKQLIICYKSITILVNTFESLKYGVLIQGFFLPHYVTKIIVWYTVCTEDKIKQQASWPRYITKLIIWQGSLKGKPSILIGSFLVGISPYGQFPWKWSNAAYFLFSKAGNFKTSISQVPYNKLLTNLACLSRTGEYWPSVDFCTDLAALGLYCHDLGPIFCSTAHALG